MRRRYLIEQFQRVAQQFERARFDTKAETLLSVRRKMRVASSTKLRLWSTRIKAQRSDRSGHSSFKQIAPAVGIKTQRQRVDREITAAQVQLDAPLLHRGEHGRLGVKLGARCHKVQMSW